MAVFVTNVLEKKTWYKTLFNLFIITLRFHKLKMLFLLII